jgi:hypothetical protein
LGETSATVSGVVDPDGLPVTACVFEYGTSTGYGQSVPCSTSPGSGSGPVAVSAELTGLESLKTYHFRLKVSNANGSNAGQDHGAVLGSMEFRAASLPKGPPLAVAARNTISGVRCRATARASFVATGVLAEGARAGKDNLYVESEVGSTWSTRLVAVLSEEDAPDWTLNEGPARMTSRVSPDGRGSMGRV